MYFSTPYDDSSYQSSFYSFLKTDKSDESMMSENEKLEVRARYVNRLYSVFASLLWSSRLNMEK